MTRNPPNPLPSAANPPDPAGLARAASRAERTQRDPNTVANYGEFRTRHVRAALEVDFEGRRLFGVVGLRVQRVGEGEGAKVVLDSSFLDIESVSVAGGKVKWSLSDRIEPFGNALTVELDGGVKEGDEVEIEVWHRRWLPFLGLRLMATLG